MDKLIELLISSGPPALLVLVGLVWGKNLIEYFFKETIEIKKDELAQNLENYKKEIEQENKNFQHQLDAKLQEFNIKFASLHNERAEIIKNLYTKLIELHSAIHNFTRVGHLVYKDAKIEEQDRIDRVDNSLKEFTNYYLPNKIFFSKSIISKIDVLFKDYWNTGFDFAKVLRDRKNPPQYRDSKIDEWKNISDKVDSYFPPLIEELENDFRDILGVNN